MKTDRKEKELRAPVKVCMRTSVSVISGDSMEPGYGFHWISLELSWFPLAEIKKFLSHFYWHSNNAMFVSYYSNSVKM